MICVLPGICISEKEPVRLCRHLNGSNSQRILQEHFDAGPRLGGGVFFLVQDLSIRDFVDN